MADKVVTSPRCLAPKTGCRYDTKGFCGRRWEGGRKPIVSASGWCYGFIRPVKEDHQGVQ